MSTISIDPLQLFKGDDGSWGTFPVKVGSSGSTFDLLPATSVSAIWLVSTGGCTSSDPSTCPDDRGGLFDRGQSTTYVSVPGVSAQLPDYDLPFNSEFDLNSALPQNPQQPTNYTGTGVAGLDTVRFGYQGTDSKPLNQQFLYSYPGDTPWLGLIGLNPDNTTLPTNVSYYSPLGALNASGQIPSATYGYHAGAYYRSVLPSLTFGGYDASRGNVNNVLNVNMSQYSNRDISVFVQDITLNFGGRTTTVPDTMQSWFIDSLVPEIWLPVAACKVFENTLGLTWDATSGLYLVNDSVHDRLVSQNISITFDLTAGNASTQIRLPYAALNQTVSYPILGNTSNNSVSSKYFPLRRAQNDTQFILGRTFLQEAYIGVDYDNNVFNVSPATFSTSPPSLVTIEHFGSSPPPSPSLSSGAIAGIVVGVVVAIALIAALLTWLLLRRRRTRSDKKPDPSDARTGSVSSTTVHEELMMATPPAQPAAPPIDGYFKPELAATEVSTPPLFKTELDSVLTERNSPQIVHELDAGSVHARSRSSVGISPLDDRGASIHSRAPSDPSLSGFPSPPSALDRRSPSLGDTPIHSRPSPSAELPGWTPAPFELDSRSRPEQQERLESTREDVEPDEQTSLTQ